MPRLFALDHNFPQPIAEVLGEFQMDAELVRIVDVHPGLAELDDWQLLLALRHHPRPWDGLITTDSSILNQPLELSVLIQTRLTLVVALEAGHNPVKATGLLFAYLSSVCQRTDPSRPQVWKLSAANRPQTSSRGTSWPALQLTSTATRQSSSRSTDCRPKISSAIRWPSRSYPADEVPG